MRENTKLIQDILLEDLDDFIFADETPYVSQK